MAAKTPSTKVQTEAISHVKRTFENYQHLSRDYRERMLDVYEAFSTFKGEKHADWATAFKINKAHEVVEKILPRVIAKNPRWIVTPRIDDFIPETQLPEDPRARQAEKEERLEKAKQYSEAIQDYLSYVFEEYGLDRQVRLWAKNMLVYGKGFAKTKFKRETARVYKQENGKTVLDETVVGEYPTIDVKSWTDMYWDPRYRSVEDMPALIEIQAGVRLADLLRKKDEYFNLDKIKDATMLDAFEEDPEGFAIKMRQITGVQDIGQDSEVDEDALTLRVYYGWFSENEKPENEKLWKIVTVDDLFVIQMEELLRIPFEEMDCFDDVEVNQPVGFVEPIIGLQDEMNFKKNSASEYVNHALNRSWVWSPNSGIDPRDLISKPNNIIATSKDAATAQANLFELPHRTLDSSYFAEQNDLERQIQAMTFTVDTANPRSQQALTNTATGIRVKFFETNSVINEIRKHFEQSLERLAYKLLQETFDNLEDNIVIKKLGEERYFGLNKEVFRDAINRYTIKIEVNSSSFDDIESRREDALAWFNVLLQAKAAGVPINMTAAVKDIAHTFEKKDPAKFIEQPDLQEFLARQVGGGSPLPQPERPTSEAARVTQQVAQGGLTADQL